LPTPGALDHRGLRRYLVTSTPQVRHSSISRKAAALRLTSFLKRHGVISRPRPGSASRRGSPAPVIPAAKRSTARAATTAADDGTPATTR
jgi:hypothetical protein